MATNDFFGRVEPACPPVIPPPVASYVSDDLISELYEGGQPKCRETNLTRRSLLKNYEDRVRGHVWTATRLICEKAESNAGGPRAPRAPRAGFPIQLELNQAK
jgi:hypothetical protein